MVIVMASSGSWTMRGYGIPFIAVKPPRSTRPR
jgi:hypothetical protein